MPSNRLRDFVSKKKKVRPRSAFGSLFRELRVATGMSLREFCDEYGYDPGNISRLERGVSAPPKSKGAIENYARSLDLAPDSDAWIQFLTAADVSAGRIPQDILEDDDVAACLPVLFRTLKSEKPTRRQLEEVIQLLRRK